MNLNSVIFFMITLAVIGMAVLIGLWTYNTTAYNSNVHALTLDMSHFTSLVFTYWKTPVVGGGAGEDVTQFDIAKLSGFMGMAHIISDKPHKEYYSSITENGEIRVISITGNVVVLMGLGKQLRNKRFPTVTCTVNLYSFTVNTITGNAVGF